MKSSAKRVLDSITCESIHKKVRKSRELKHLSTEKEKSTERPKVVASEIGKACLVVKTKV